MLIHDLLNLHDDEKIAFRYQDQSITMGDFKKNVHRLRAYFNTKGIQAEDHVGLYSKNCPEFVYAYFAIVSMGAIIVPINRMLTSKEVAYIASDAGFKHLITQTTLELDASIEQLIISDYTNDLTSFDNADFPICASIDEDTVATIIYTSGTTGYPKGAMLTHKNIMSNANSCVNIVQMTPADKLLCVLPMFHSFSWTVVVVAGLQSASTTVIVENFYPKDILKLIQKEEISVIYGVPAMFAYYLSLGTKEDFVHLRTLISSGAPLPVEIITQFYEKFGFMIVEGYGLSEASPTITVNRLDQVKVGSVGIAIDQVEVKIIDENGTEVPHGTIGELIARGPNIMKGYLNLPEVTAKTVVDGWLHTGDFAYQDSEGYYFVVDRLKDVIIVGGINVYPREIEEVIYKYNGIVEASVISEIDEKRGEVPIAYLVTQDNANFDVKALKLYLREHLASFKQPRDIILVDSLPKNATGKILKKDIRVLHAASQKN